MGFSSKVMAPCDVDSATRGLGTVKVVWWIRSPLAARTVTGMLPVAVAVQLNTINSVVLVLLKPGLVHNPPVSTTIDKRMSRPPSCSVAVLPYCKVNALTAVALGAKSASTPPPHAAVNKLRPMSKR